MGLPYTFWSRAQVVYNGGYRYLYHTWENRVTRIFAVVLITHHGMYRIRNHLEYPKRISQKVGLYTTLVGLPCRLTVMWLTIYASGCGISE